MEKNYRNIISVTPPPPFHMVGDGFRVHNFFPSDETGMDGMSPFFLLDYGSKYYFPPSEKARGVDVHPHRGFETVTISYHGRVAHHDSAGNKGVIREGDVQWMTAASGVLHKEYHEMEFTRKGGDFQMAQIWVNLPSEYKMIQPRYQALENKDLGRHRLDDKGSIVEVIAGEYKGTKGPAMTFTPINLFNARLKAGSSAEFLFPNDYNCGMVVIEGEVVINGGVTAPVDHFIYFGHEGEEILVEAKQDSIVLIMSGEPIDEPIAAHGPFLMNTEEEIRQAFDDYRKGKFGFLDK